MGRKIKKVDISARPPLKVDGNFRTDNFLMYLIQEVTKLGTADILGFFADLSKVVAEEGVHFMHEQGTSSMRKQIFDFFPGTCIPFCLKVEGNKNDGRRYDHTTRQYIEGELGVRHGNYYAVVGFPSATTTVDQTKLADIIMEKAILGACDMPAFEKPDTKCPKMCKDLMKEVQSRRMV